MKRYKLIKKFPGGPALNYITTNSEGWFGIHKCEDYPEFWEEIIEYPIGTRVLNSHTDTIYTKKEDCWYFYLGKTGYTDEQIRDYKHITVIDEKVVEKDYEILSFIQNISKEIVLVKPADVALNEKAFIKNGSWDIHSIKRLSDGEIFTIGDKITDEDNSIIHITKFDIHNNELQVEGDYFKHIHNGTDCIQRLKDIIKYKQPLFTTEDGVDIFEGDFAYECARNNSFYKNVNKFTPLEECRHTYKTIGVDWIVFSTKEAAEEYILMNKPIFTGTDILLYLDIFGNIVKDVQKERIKTIAKSKL